MTKINKLVMHGFKSFAKRTELVFGPGFNCILGPNGSGKSNVLDALCFVLGKSSSKSLRAEKSSNLIYNGGKSKKASDRAEVSIFFDNSKKEFPTEDPEVKVSRIVKESGQSTYKINDHTRTREEVVELLSLSKLDPDGYNIILQGDIVRFVEMHPVERRQLIEEIAGISVYEEKKQKAINELNNVEERLKEADIILTERQVHLKELKKERNQAEKYKELNEKINTNKATFLYRQMEAKKAEAKKNKEQGDGYQSKIDKLNEEIAKIKKAISEKKEAVNKINDDIEKKGEREQIELHKDIEKIKVSYGTSKNRVETIKNEINKLKMRKEQLLQNVKEIEGKIADTKIKTDEAESFQKSYEKELDEIEKKIDVFKKKNALESAADFEKQIEKIDKEVEEKQAKIQEMRQRQQELLREKDRLEFQINTLDDTIAKVLEIEKENKEKIDELKDKKNDFKRITLELNTLLNDDSTVSAQLGNSRKRILSLHEDLSKLKARSMGIQEKIAGDNALKEILRQKDNIEGIYGTVSELGQVDSKYAVALEIAAGPKIKSVVVENDAVAAKCINFLKSKKLGVVTFLPLNKIKEKGLDPESAKYEKSEGVHGFAVDLISFDQKFNRIFSYVFGSALVVDNLEIARRIGVGNAKMVTLDGDITELSGAMQGGFREKLQGSGFMEKDVAESIEKIEKEIDTTQSLISGLERKKTENEEKLEHMRLTKTNLEADIIKLEKTLHLESGDLDASKKQKKDLEEQLEKNEKEFSRIQNDLSDINKVLAESKTAKQELRDKITQLRNPRLLAELNAFEEKRNELKEKLMKHKLDIENNESHMKNMLNPEKDRIAKIIKQQDKEEEDFDAEMKRLVKELTESEKQMAEKEKIEKKFYQQFKDLFTDRTKELDDITKREAKMDELNESARKEEITLNTFNLKNAEFMAQLAGMEKEFEQYQGVRIDHQKSDEQLKKEINQFEKFIQNLGAVNMKALEIYDSIEKEYNDLMKKKDKLQLEKEDVLVMMNEIDLKKKELFMQTLDVVNGTFQEFFKSLSSKGEAHLALENPENPFEEGLLIRVKITGKRFLDIKSLSGGEKTMTALAFIFAIQENEPAPFIIMDEVDAALDKRNSEKLAQLIRKYLDRAQYIVISHNDGIIGSADLLYGVSMDEHGMSNLVSLKI